MVVAVLPLRLFREGNEERMMKIDDDVLRSGYSKR